MKVSLPYLIIIAVALVIFPFFSPRAEAGSLTNTIVRLDRTKAGEATGGIVCAQTPAVSGGTVAKVAVTFPLGFTLNSNISNWTVTTSDLPTGANAWPGIDTASNVSGRTVTFPSSNLADSTYYCFNFSGTDTLTNGDEGNHQTGTVTTLNSSGQAIDYKTFALSIVSDDQIGVSATVPANPTDFNAQLSSDTPDNVAQSTTTKYTFNYGSNLTTATSITIEVEWSLGTVSGDSVPTIDLLEYSVGSATNAYNSAPPVVDLVNRKIVWTISSFPANIDKTVSFLLSTKTAYTGSKPVSFTVSGRVLGPGTQTADSTVTKNYVYNYSSPVPTGTSSEMPTLSPISTPAKEPTFSFGNISVEEISDKTVRIRVNTNDRSTVTVLYGTSLNKLTNTFQDKNLTTSHVIYIEKLSADTKYYFKIRAEDENGKILTSDLFTFQSAQTQETPQIETQSIIVTSNNKVILSGFGIVDSLTKKLIGILPTQNPFEFTFSLKNPEWVKRIEAYSVNDKVLGINSDQTSSLASLSGNGVEITEISTGVFTGRFVTPTSTGIYEIYAKVYDIHGNISNQKLISLKVIKPLTILAADNKKPIEAAKVTILIYNPRTKTYNRIPSELLLYKNSGFTDPDGTIRYALPAGIYKAEVSAIGFKSKTQEFTLGSGTGEDFPTIYLEREPFNIISSATYYINTVFDVIGATQSYIADLSTSVRFFDLIAAVALAFLIITVIFSFCVKTHIPLQHIPAFLLFALEDLVFKRTQQKYIHGVVHDHHGKPLTRTVVEIIDAKSKQTLAKVQTNKTGEFFINKSSIAKAKKYALTISKDGYHGMTVEYLPDAMVGKLQFILQATGEETTISYLGLILRALENLFGFGFEFLLAASLLFELIFINTIGSFKAVPFVLLTLLTILLWVVYAHRILRKNMMASY